jgi:hypothetical protein
MKRIITVRVDQLSQKIVNDLGHDFTLHILFLKNSKIVNYFNKIQVDSFDSLKLKTKFKLV